jgi:hypothetical protein
MLILFSFKLIAHDILAPGNISGYVFNYYGVAVAGAVVGIEDGPYTTSGADGHYFLQDISSGEQNLGCGKAGYNPVWIGITVVSADTVYQDFTLTQPSMMINPLELSETVNPGEYFTTPVSVLNSGSGILTWTATVSYISMPVVPCEYSIALCDTWGDGWNGCSVDVLVNDSIVLDNITLQNGAGPVYFYFNAFSGDQVTTDFNPGPFVSEPYYYVYNNDGEQVWFSPADDNGPPDIPPGQLTASCPGGSWLTLDSYSGEVQPFGGVKNVPVHLDASGMGSGDVYNAEILFTSIPNVGQATIPVSMTVLGNEILPVEDLEVELIDQVAGRISLSWDWNGEEFQFFLIKRNGSIIATTTSQSYLDMLPLHGNYCYTVQALYNEGISSPTGPACIEWPDPVLAVNPDDIEGWVWSGFTADVFTTIANNGQGTLSYSFPEFAAIDLLEHPGSREELGAGGPDEFGYVWIDSDEPGGPEFSYTDISTTGIPVFDLADDNIVGPFNIGFDFFFYGEVKSQFWINSNGCIGFTSNKITIQNTAIPTHSSIYKDFIAWMWDDLVYRPGFSQVFYKTYPDKLIIQFKNYEHIYQANLPINAEVVIYKNGKILLLYDSFASGVITNSCTIGLQSSSPEIGLQVAFNENYLHDDLAVFMRVPGDFIIDVEPAYGIIPENSSSVITITYDSKQYVPGPYTQELLLESNDLNNPEYLIDNTMHVYLPALFSGTVYDQDDDDPLNGVLITAGPYQATTGEDGQYSLYVDEGKYDLVFEKLGYLTVTIEDTLASEDEITPVNTGMWDNNYPPSLVHAEVMDNDTWCELTWGLPQGPYEMIMDDGEADDFFVYASAGSWNAVKFTPAGYPATVIGGSFYVGDGSFPGPFLGTGFGVAVFDDDGMNGLPGTMLDSNGVTVNNSGWVNLDWLEAEIESGSFYLAMYQSGNMPHAAPIGVDMDNPTHFKSYSKYQSGNWNLSPLQDFMIRAWIISPDANAMNLMREKKLMAVPRVPENWHKYALTASGKIPAIKPGFKSNEITVKAVSGMSNRDVVNYRVAQYVNFDLDDPLAGGDFIELSTTQNLYYYDFAWWSVQAPGWYAFAVKALYSSGIFSSYSISNIVGHLMDCQATFNISLTTGLDPENVEITLQGLDYPYETFTGNTSSSGVTVFDMIWKGHYDIKVYKIGFETYTLENVNIHNDEIFDIILSEKKYSPSCLYVDPVSLIGTWCEPKRTAVIEGFEGEEFPPAGWQALSADDEYGWFRSNNASSQGFVIPPWDGYYAVVNNDMAGSENNGCCDYLITPPLDLRESEGYAIYFDSFYNGDFGQLAYLEYSLDEGETWQVLYQLVPVDSTWDEIEFDLSAFSGSEGPPEIWLAFHSDNDGMWTSGWAVDNVAVQVPDPAASYLDFLVFLDNAYIGTTSETTWDFAPLAYGQTYTVSVAARYSSGLSSKVHYTFESKYLFPPQDLNGTAPDDAVILDWDPPGATLPFNLYGYNIYRDDVFLYYKIQEGGWEPQEYVDQEMEPGIYSYKLSAVYDLEPYGFPGETGESMKIGPEIVTVDYCNELEFYETWDVGSFGLNSWKTDGPNWKVSGQTGNPAPVAEFNSTPAQTDYEISLESYPLCAVGLTEGSIWLDFDLAMYAFNPTGVEYLQVQVWGWDNKQWATVSEYANTSGGFDWTIQRINLGELALDKVFKIRFRAIGSNSLDVRGWFVDNIHIYRICAAPENLAIDPGFYEGVRLTWEYPESGKSGSDSGNRDLVGYYIYRSENGGEYQLLTENYTGIPYIDPDSNLAAGAMYCYKVTAVHLGESDQCISDFSNEVCVIWTGTGHDFDDEEIKLTIYPNPAIDRLNIRSSEEIRQIELFNSLGVIIYLKSYSSNNIELNTSGLPAGAYILQIETGSGTYPRMLTIKR